MIRQIANFTPSDGSITSAKIADGTIVNADVNASADIAWNKISKSGATASDVGAASTSHTHTATDISEVTDKRFMSDAQETKVDYLTVTASTDLDSIRTRVVDLDAAVILRGTWDASGGTFPGSGTAQAGASYIVSVGGTVDSVAFAIGDRIIAIVDNASASTYASNWFKADYTDAVSSVQGSTGAVTITDANLSTSDVTTNDSSTSKHGFLKKLSNTATEFMDGTGAWDSVKDSDLSTTDITTNDVTTSKHGFTPKAPNDTAKFLRGDASWATLPAAGDFTWVVKASDESVTYDNTGQDDNDLLFSVSANKIYEVELCVYGHNNGGANNLVGSIVIPSGNSFGVLGYDYEGVQRTLNVNTYDDFLRLNESGYATPHATYYRFKVKIGGTGGTLQLRWCSSTYTSNAVVMSAGSHIKYRQLD